MALVRHRCVESTQRLSPMIRAQSGARGRASALVCYYKMVLVRCCCGESTMILIIEPRVRLAVMPEHSYADTRLRWFDVVVESPQRLSLKNRAQSGARGRAGALVGKYGVALVRRRCVESTQRLSPMIRVQSEARGRASALGCLYKMALVRRYCGESTMTGLKNRAQSEARGHVGALVCKYEIALVRRCCGEYTTTKS